MSDAKPPNRLFWLIAILALVWNGMSALNFITQVTGSEGLPEKYANFVDSRPVWATAGFGVSAAASVLGSIGLLLRRRWAYQTFLVAFLGMLVTLLFAAPVQVVSGKFSVAELILSVVMPLAISIFLVWYSGRSREAGALR